MRASDFSPDLRKRLVPVAGRENVKALVPLRCPRTLDALPVLDLLVAAERAIARSAATAQSLLKVRQEWRSRTAHLRSDAAARRLLDVLLGAPVQTVASARAALGAQLSGA